MNSIQTEFKREAYKKEYTSRINRVIDYIETHIYDDLSLEVLAEVAKFSRFHFHRIFSSVYGETLSQYIQRIRVEKAATQLLSYREKSVTDIAFDCGFSGSAAFARVFKEKFGISASEWRNISENERSKICKKDGKNYIKLSNYRKESNKVISYNVDYKNLNIIWRYNMKDLKDVNVEVKNMEEMNVAYVRHTGPYKGDEKLFEGLFSKLMQWAGPRDLIKFPESKMLAVYHDNPEITDEDKLRLSVCLTVPEETKVDGEIGNMKISAGKYAIGHFELNKDEYPQAWGFLYGTWMPQSGFQPDDGLCYENYLNDPKEHPEGKCIVEITIPVKPL